jgi:hypothetical protein
VALTRPPRTDATIYSRIEEPLSDDRLDVAIRKAEIKASETAYLMAITHPRVVMVTAQGITGIEEI